MNKPTTLFTALCLAAPGLAQQPTGITAHHEAGQTFVSWDEASSPDVLSYLVYRDADEITSLGGSAVLLGEVRRDSSRNIRFDLADPLAPSHYWKIPNGGVALTELADDEGLFVVTVPDGPADTFYYAVVAVGSTPILTPGANATDSMSGVLEAAANTTAYLQLEEPLDPPLAAHPDAWREVWSHWGTNTDTIDQDRFSPWASAGFNFQLVYQSDPNEMGAPLFGLIARCHGLNFNFNSGNPTAEMLFDGADDSQAGEVVVLGLDDPLIVIDGVVEVDFSRDFWFGVRDGFDFTPTYDVSGDIDFITVLDPVAEDEIVPYSLNRLSWTMEWVQVRSAFSGRLDPNRVFAIGSSMGAIGTMRLLERHPELFAAAFSRHGNYDPSSRIAPPVGPTEFALFDSLFGDPWLDLNIFDTMPAVKVYDRLNSSDEVAKLPGVEWPFIRTIQGKYDYTVGWDGVPQFLEAMQTEKRAGAHYFDNKGHDDISPMSVLSGGSAGDLEAALIARTLQHTMNEPVLHFGEFTLDDDFTDSPEFDEFETDAAGAISGYADWARGSVTLNPPLEVDKTEIIFDSVFLQPNSEPDAAQVAEGMASLTPRRTGTFQANLSVGEIVHYVLSESSVIKDEHLLFADDNGLVTTPPTPLTPLSLSLREATFSYWTTQPTPHLFVGDGPLAGDDLQYVVFGGPNDVSWEIEIGIAGLGWLPFADGDFSAGDVVNATRTLPTNSSGTTFGFRLQTNGPLGPTFGPVFITVQ